MVEAPHLKKIVLGQCRSTSWKRQFVCHNVQGEKAIAKSIVVELARDVVFGAGKSYCIGTGKNLWGLLKQRAGKGYMSVDGRYSCCHLPEDETFTAVLSIVKWFLKPLSMEFMLPWWWKFRNMQIIFFDINFTIGMNPLITSLPFSLYNITKSSANVTRPSYSGIP